MATGENHVRGNSTEGPLQRPGEGRQYTMATGEIR